MRRKRFTDNAGYTRHCWECLNSTDWEEGRGICSILLMDVERHDSPNNPCSTAGGCYLYTTTKPKTIAGLYGIPKEDTE